MALRNDVTKSSEMLWLDVLDSEEKGDREDALSKAYSVVDLEDSHSDAWMAIARLNLPPTTRGKPMLPDLKQCSKAMSAIRKVVLHDPSNNLGWELGGALLVDHLGMLEHALNWWEDCRRHDPYAVTPLVEQIGILVRLGYYEDCVEKLEELFSQDMDAPANKQLLRMHSVKDMVEKAAKMETSDVFKPNNPKNPRWEIIRRLKNRKPITQNLFLLTFTAPIVFIIGTFAMSAFGSSAIGTVSVFLLILFLFALISRLTMGLLNSLNRHALDLDRAIDFESTTGKVCIPDDIRKSKLYLSMIKNRMPCLNERLDIIVTSNEKMSKNWSINIP